MKTVRTLSLNGGVLIIPVSMSENELIKLIGTLAIMQRIDSVYSKDYESTYSYPTGNMGMTVQELVVFDTEAQAKAARDSHNAALDKKKGKELA